MTMDRMALAAFAALGALSVGACHRAAEVSDVELTALLRTEHSRADDPRAPLDFSAVSCLRAWSGDAALMKDLPPAVSGDGGKASCRERVQVWISDKQRNPAMLRFEDVSTPAVAGRAAALLAEHRPTPTHSQASSGNAPAPVSIAPPSPRVPATAQDVSTARAAVDELDRTCEDAKQRAATQQNVARYASFCRQQVGQLRSRIDTISQTGDQRQLQALTKNAQNLIAVGKRLAAGTPPGQ